MNNPITITNEATRQVAIKRIADLSLDDKAWDVSVEKHVASRTLAQNRLYHRWLGIIASDTGNSHEAIHEHCRKEFLPPLFAEIAGKTYGYRRSTTALNVPEMLDYMSKVEVWAWQDLGIILPPPPQKTEER